MKMNKEKVQEKYIELQIIEQHIKQLQKQIQMVESQITELATAHEALEDFKKLQAGTKILVPISNGIFAKAEVKDTKELIVNVGANVTVNKDVEAAKSLIQEQIDEMKSFQERVILDLQNLGEKGSSLETELQSMISEK